MEILIKENGYVNFLIEYVDIQEHSITFKVEQVVSWETDDNNTVSETEHYLKGDIRWDGCSHFNFGNENGYMHLCGKSCYNNMTKVLEALWKVASEKIKNWDKDN